MKTPPPHRFPDIPGPRSRALHAEGTDALASSFGATRPVFVAHDTDSVLERGRNLLTRAMRSVALAGAAVA